MHDPFLKSVFADRRMIEILIRTHVRHWVDEIDFPTLRSEPTELVSTKTLERRHPDMVWSARTRDGAKVLLLLEFQRTADPLMALRTATYATLKLEAIAAARSGTAARLPEAGALQVYFDGDRPYISCVTSAEPRPRDTRVAGGKPGPRPVRRAGVLWFARSLAGNGTARASRWRSM